MKVILDDASNHAKNGKKKEGIGTQDPDSEHEVDVVLAFGGKVLKVKTDVMVSQQMSWITSKMVMMIFMSEFDNM